MVDSPAMTDLSGTNPTAVSIGVWAVSIFFAGLAGVLAAPIIGLDAANYTLLIAATFAAVIAARLRNLPIAVGVALLMGVATSLIQRYLPPASTWTSEIIDAVPFIVIALVLIYNLIRRGGVGDKEGWGGALDRAIAPQGESRLAGSTSSVVESASLNSVGRYAGPVILVVLAGALPMILEWVLGRAGGPGLRLRCDLPVVDPRDGRGRDALAVPDHLCRGRGTDHGPVGQPLRVAGSGRRGGRGPRGRRHGSHCRLPEHPARRPLRRPGDAHLRTPDREPRLHPAELREPGARAESEPARLRRLRLGLLLPVSGGLRPRRPVHRQPPAVRPPGSPSTRPAGAKRERGHRASAWCR